MNKLTQMNDINVSSVMPETVTVVSVDTESIQPTTTTAHSGGSGSLFGWVNIGVSICIAIIVWTIVKKTTSEIRKLQCRLNKNDSIINDLSQNIEKISHKVKMLENTVKTNTQHSTPKDILPTTVSEYHGNKYADTIGETENPTQYQIKFATLQSPDENGILRFSERSMIENSSPQKMFLLEIDTVRGIGTYRINPSAKGLILGDLQMFQDFVKPFNFSGDSINATIQDKVPGKISRQGNFWVVDELLEISIN